MSKKAFEEFLNKNTSSSEGQESINWDVVKTEWLRQLSILYSNIDKWLKEYVDNGQIIVKKRDETLHENHLGDYKVQVIQISFGNKRVDVVPKARLIIGGYGRVDLLGLNSKEVRFILTDEKSTGVKISIQFGGEPVDNEIINNKNKSIKLVWKIATPPPQIKYLKLDEDSFFSSLMQVING